MAVSQAMRQRYSEVINSFRWKAIRRRLFKERGYKCERCGLRAGKLSLHHKTYDRLGSELDGDLEILCESCHKEADAERAQRGRQRSSAALYDAQLEGWASKRYGDDWADYGDADSIEEEFSEWLERRED